MELSAKQQSIEQLKQAQKILILTHKNPDGDSLGSLLALKKVLERLGKKVTAVVSDPIPASLTFLAELDRLETELRLNREFVLHLDLTKTQVANLGYRKIEDNQKLAIIITPKSGQFRAQDVSFPEPVADFDLVIVLDTPDLARLGNIGQNFRDLFYETPVINIDHHPSNDYFGQVNWVEITATSTAEILVGLIEALASPDHSTKELIDSQVATALLTGITTDTGSFQNANTTPKALTIAAQLVAAGAEQQQIIRQIYKTKPLSTLKLWGRALSRLRTDETHRYAYTYLGQADFSELKAETNQSSGLIDDLLKTAQGYRFVALITEKNGSLHVSLRALETGINLNALATACGGGGHDLAAAFEVKSGTLKDSLESTLSQINACLVNQPG
ncbi:MAG: Uncharacterized protein CEO22_108 [Candidatus Berkelbacteria bacterium Gr01-1014_85]|uniref:Phosphoesterase RecJ domain-containing protein n=1 Tax=Candidatus Berkelbacteria bacterium Gr01-1014_85 TaxID=2017150 RepID=A0A554JDB4_9BACT|nr:MAG: Uncharacterized protein CEO22_108 [Candidatus Berkelbacteria bacterium Gr01-1014_85]